MRTVLAVIGMVLFLSCSVLILAGWRNPDSRFLTGMLATRDSSATDPARTAAAGCWLILGFAAGSIGLLVSGGSLDSTGGTSARDVVGAVCAVAVLVGIAVAGWVRFGDAPVWLRPVVLRPVSDAGTDR